MTTKLIKVSAPTKFKADFLVQYFKKPSTLRIDYRAKNPAICAV